jgi:hypothetical protein
LATGTVRIESSDPTSDHVIVTAPDGSVISESWCGGAGMTYDDVVTFFVEFQRRVAQDDRKGVAQMIAFPLRVFAQERYQIKTTEEFVRRFAEIFTPAVVRAVRAAEPRFAFCRSDGTMLGSGVLWAGVRRGNRLRVFEINR